MVVRTMLVAAITLAAPLGSVDASAADGPGVDGSAADAAGTAEATATAPEEAAPARAGAALPPAAPAGEGAAQADPPGGLAADARALCEAPDELRGTSREQRMAVRRLVIDTARSAGADPRIFQIWAVRESDYRPFKRHRMQGDEAGARRAWIRVADRYGWALHAPKGKKVDLDRVKASQLRDDANPTYADASRWASAGLGLYGLNPALHLWRWDDHAQPETLCDPVIATEVVRRLACRAVAIGARNWLEVNQVFGRGRIGPRGSFDRAFIRRARSAGLDPYARPQLGRCDEGPRPGQAAWAEEVRGAPLGRLPWVPTDADGGEGEVPASSTVR